MRQSTSTDGSGAGRGAQGTSALANLERLAGDLEGTLDERPREQPTRSSGSRLEGVLPVRSPAYLLDDPIFPKTEDYVTSAPLELAMELAPGELVGWVSDNRGDPLPDTLVSLKYEPEDNEEESGEESDRVTNLTTRSNDSGLFQIDDIPPGHWSLTAEKANYGTESLAGLSIRSNERHSPVELRLSPELQLRGTVRGAGRALEDAEVRIYREQLSIRSEGAVGTVRLRYGDAFTDKDGRFEVKQLPEGPLRIRAAATGFATHEARMDLRPDTGSLEITLEPESILAGSVRNELGESIEGAELVLRQPDSRPKDPPVGKVTSDGNGSFTFRQLTSATPFELTVKAAGYAQAGPIPVTSGTSQNIIVMTSGGAIEGRVTNFETDQPMAGIGVVAISAEEGRSVSLWTRTNSEGRYRITRLPAGTYDVSTISQRHTSAPKLGNKVEAEKITGGVDFSIYPGIEISGTVVDGETGERLPNATVTVNSRVGPKLLLARSNRATTDEAGGFRFENLPQGIYTLEASLQGYMAGVGEESSVRVELVRGRLAEPVEIKLYRGGFIDGIVLDHGGNPVREALVQVFHAGGTPSRINHGQFKDTTTVNGTFAIEGIPVHNEVHLFLSATARDQPKGRSERVILNRQLAVKNVPIILPVGGNLQVQAEDPSGLTIEGVTISLSHPDFSGDSNPSDWRQETEGTGRASFSQLPPGRMNFSAGKSGYLGASGRADIRSLQTARATVVLEPALSLAGKVRDDRLNPIQNGSVTARAERGARGSGSSGFDGNGSFKIETLGEGSFRLDVDARKPTPTGNHRVVWSFPGIQLDESGAEVNLEVPFSGGIQGRVYGSDTGNPPPRYSINIQGHYFDDAGNRRGFSSSHNFDGDDTYRFESIPPGEYTVRASASNFLPAEIGPITVESPGTYSAQVMRLEAGGRLTFTVVDAETGEPVGGVLGRLVDDGPSGRTNNQGRVNISPITPDIYNLELSHGEYLPQTEHLIQISRGRETDLGEIAMRRGAVLYGRVQDGRGEPLRGVTVEARSVDDDKTRRTNTDAGGRYSLRGLTLGGHIVTYSARVENRNVSRSINLTVSADRDREQNMVLRADARLEGLLSAAPSVDVSRAVVALYPLRPNRTPIVNERVDVREVSGSRFVAENLAEGLYLVAVQAPRIGAGSPAYWSSVVQVTFPESRAPVVQGPFTLSGRIQRSGNGPPVPDQEIRLELLTAPETGVGDLRRWWQWTMRTDEAGNYTFEYIPPGTYSLTAHSESLGSDILEILTVSGSNTLVRRNFHFTEGE